MAENKKHEEEVLVDVVSQISGVEKFIQKNQKHITTAVIGVLVLVGGYWGYTNYYLAPREKAAAEAIVFAQLAFESDSLQQALNGNGEQLGFLDVADEYSGTKTGNLAHYYAGMSYMNLGEFENAIRELDKFSPKDPVFTMLTYGAIGDAFHEINQPKEALEYYEKAIAGQDNEFLLPFLIRKAGLTAEMQGDYKKALKHYNDIKNRYPKSREATDANKMIARAEALAGNK